MTVTTFNAVGNNKIPLSPYNDRTFDFVSKKVNDVSKVFDYMTREYILNIPLIHIKEYHSRKKKSDLEKYTYNANDNVSYLILDIDYINTIEEQKAVIDFFKKLNCNVILGESRTFPRIKGVIEANVKFKDLWAVVEELQENLPYGEIDKSVLHISKHQAPIGKRNILLQVLNKTPYVLKNPNRKEKVKVPKSISKNGYSFVNTNNPTEFLNENLNKMTPSQKLLFEISYEYFVKEGFEINGVSEYGFVCSHPSEIKTPNGFTWNPMTPTIVFHWNPNRSISLHENVKKDERFKEYLNIKNNEEINEIFNPYGIDNKSPKGIVDMPVCIENFHTNVNIINGKLIPEFYENTIPYSIFVLQSPMNTGKSSSIEKILELADMNSDRVLFITNRISLADDISQKYSKIIDIKHYNADHMDDDYYTPGDNLVVQVDSLWRYSLKNFDIVIIDEFTSVIQKLLNVSDNQTESTSKFFKIPKIMKKVFLLDAFFFDTHLDIFSNIKNRYFIQNKYRENVNVNVYEHKSKFFDVMVNAAKKEQITVSAGSLTILKTLEKKFLSMGLKVLKLDSSTKTETKKTIYSGFRKNGNVKLHEKLKEYDVILFSPTITTGVSIELGIKKHFHYDTGNSMSPISSIQMLRRNRNATEIGIYVSNGMKRYPTDYNLLKDNFSDHFLQDEYGDFSGLDEIGNILLHLQKFENIMKNSQKEALLRFINLQFEGYRIINEKSENVIKKEHKEVLNENKELYKRGVLDFIHKDKYSPHDLQYLLADRKFRGIDEFFVFVIDHKKEIIDKFGIEVFYEILEIESENKGYFKAFVEFMEKGDIELKKSISYDEYRNLGDLKKLYKREKGVKVIRGMIPPSLIMQEQ